ncbi:type I-E CRISPR-associated protein Cas6/Cse3/CasE [Nocardiopsis listeri]|uniref:type I-E CRISPR-associated protein Cas6/Cse3/CasE n=1 Tax=Nocardiopsis listeri TaxID=53440 RepID=UPI000836F13E|nr:type I-E CRISPR-associated protein Cas6/Cse3/CasE [Nocardiopsis listeri]
MSWLTKITPDLSSKRVRTAFANAGAVHRLLIDISARELGPTPVEAPRQRVGLLFRVEETPGGPVLLVQSHHRLDLDKVAARLGHDFGRTAERDLTPFFDKLTKGQELRYRLAAAPSKRLGKSEKNAERLGKPVETKAKAYTRPLFGADAEQWWRERADRHGLDLRDVAVSGTAPALDPGRGGRRNVRHHVSRFDGHATVTDSDALRQALLEGVGRGKSFGCGLLSLAPVGG